MLHGPRRPRRVRTKTVRRRPSRAFRGTSTCSSRARRRRSSFFAGQVAEARRRRCPVEPAFAARRRRPVLLRTGRPQYLCRQPPSPPPRNVSIRVPVSTALTRCSGIGATLSYCIIVTERHASSTSSPETSNSTIAARRPLTTSHRAPHFSGTRPARRLDRFAFRESRCAQASRRLHPREKRPGAGLHAIATATASV